MPRDRMGSLENGLHCQNGAEWPPKEVFGYGEDPEACRPHVSAQRYEQIKTWKRVCGLKEMNPEKCPTCPFALEPHEGPRFERPPNSPQPPTSFLSRGRYKRWK